MGAFRYLLFAAVAFSLCVYAYRGYRRWIAPREPEPPTGAADTGDASGSSARTASTAPTATPLPAGPPPKAKAKPKRGLGFTNPNELPSERDAAESDSLVQQVIREELAKKQGVAPASGAAPASAPASPAAGGRSGLFASSSSGSSDRVSVAAALTGARLPDDLVPLVGEDADPHHVTFVTSSLPAAELGRHLGDELERLGYQVGSESDVVAVATKGAVTLRVTLHPNASTERRDGRARFPTAGPSTVVVEFET